MVASFVGGGGHTHLLWLNMVYIQHICHPTIWRLSVKTLQGWRVVSCIYSTRFHSGHLPSRYGLLYHLWRFVCRSVCGDGDAFLLPSLFCLLVSVIQLTARNRHFLNTALSAKKLKCNASVTSSKCTVTWGCRKGKGEKGSEREATARQAQTGNFNLTLSTTNDFLGLSRSHSQQQCGWLSQQSLSL